MTPQQAYGAVRLAPFSFSPKVAGVIEAQIAFDMAEDVRAEQIALGLKPGALPVLPPSLSKMSNFKRLEATLKRITDLLRANGTMTAAQMSPMMQRHVCTIHSACRELQRQNRVTIVGKLKDNQVIYALTDAELAS